jgi:hypothetical protein
MVLVNPDRGVDILCHPTYLLNEALNLLQKQACNGMALPLPLKH